MWEGIGEGGKWISSTGFLGKLTQAQAPARPNISLQNAACLKGSLYHTCDAWAIQASGCIHCSLSGGQ
jgi:hypothetical protein